MMDEFKSIKTYERHCHRYRSQQDKLISDLFDRIAADITDKGKHKSSCDSHDASGVDVDRTQRPVSKKTKQTEPAAPQSSPTDMAGSQWMESLPPSHHHEPSHTVSHCSLFESPCDIETESRPKKAKCSKQGRGSKGVKRGARKKGQPAIQHRTVRHSATAQFVTATTGRSPTAQPETTAVDVSSDYPSLETFRDMKKQSFKRSQVPKEMELSCSKSSLSMSDSFSKTIAPSQRRQRAFLLPQPWTPRNVRQRSLIKIRTSAAHCSVYAGTVERPQNLYREQEEGEDSCEVDDSSYTSVYTWTTATTTAATTRTTHTDKRTEKEGEECSSSSPTLLLKTGQDQDHLQSTAIHPHLHPHPLQHSPHLSPIRACPPPLQSTAIHSHLNPAHLQHTPHVSPIRRSPDGEDRHRTPCAPTHHVSPRGPRKTQSFLSLRGQRGVAPKCSTMLFASPMASAGDAPLDVSSIRMASAVSVSEAMELNEGADKDEGRQQKRQHETGAVGDRVLTSTPCSLHASKLKWNMSSVQVPHEEDELLHPLDSSGDTVNSQEIMAASVSDESSLPLEDDEDLEPEKVEKPAHRMEPANRLEDREKMKDTSRCLEEAADRMDTASNAGVSVGDSHSTVGESGVVVSGAADNPADPSHPHLHSLPSHHTFPHMSPRPHTPADLSEAATTQAGVAYRDTTHHAEGRRNGFESKVSDWNRGAADRFEHDGKLSDYNREQGAPFTHTHLLRKSGSVSSLKHNEAMSHAVESFSSTSLVCGPGEERKADSIVKRGGDVLQQPNRSSQEGKTDWVSPCPVSCTGYREKTTTRPPHRPPLLLWVEPADSGFLDMVNNTPPDIIDVVSRKVKEKKFPSLC